MDVYKIGVSIVLANGVSPVLAIIGRDLLGLHTSVDKINKNFGGWTAALVGVGGLLGGSMILGAMTKLAEKAGEFQDAMIKVSQLNPKVAQVVQSGELRKEAFEIGARFGMKAEDVVNIYGGIFGAIQDVGESKEILPYASAYARLMESRHPGSHPEESIRTLIRAGELSGRLYDDKGKIDPAKVKDWFDMAAIAEAATHGQVNAQTLYGMAQQAGPGSLRGLSREGYEHMMILSQEMGGQRAGTALLSLRGQMTGAMLARSADAMAHYGVLRAGEYEIGKGDHVHMTPEGSKRLLGLLNDDPVKFVDMMVEQLEKKGITNKDDQMRAITEMIGRQTSQRLVSDIVAQRQQIDRETQGLNQGATVEQGLHQYADESVNYNLHNMHAAWDRLMVAIGGPQGEHFISVLKGITGALDWATKLSSEHPQMIKLIGEALIGVAGGLIAIGAASLLALFGTGGVIFAIVASVGALVAANWGYVANGFRELGDIIWKDWTEKFRAITSGLAAFWDFIVSMYDKVKLFVAPPQSPSDQKSADDLVNGLKSGIQLQSFHPGSDDRRHGNLTLSLNIDGRTLAQTVSDQLQALTEFSMGGPAADGIGRYSSGDHNFGSV
ncbi:hypothetical protein [Bradyrhizobium sp. Tv2a-2]|uniref:hypothetical protein n=1 Tax=Bradyrhizobium sp. Tv2a-2 TaxID=113395 RepID=UPI00041A1541|nr:hypothetical protein [Bradyrhizobium sp. Tv2a-2]